MKPYIAFKSADWEWVDDIGRRAQELDAAGKMTREAWRAFMAEAFAAVNGNQDLLGFVGRYARNGWLGEVRAEEKRGIFIPDTIPVARPAHLPKSAA